MTVSNSLMKFANIRRGEGKVFTWVLLYAILSTMMYLLASTAAYALFLSEFDAQRLPYIYIGGSLFTTLISLIYLQLSKRYTMAQLLIGNFSLLLITLLGYRVGLTIFPNSWFIFSLLIWEGVFNTLLYTAYWNLVGRLFNLQQGKRLFSLLGAGQQVTTLAVGFLVPLLVAWVGTPNLLVLGAVIGIGALAVLRYITRSFAELRAPAELEEVVEEETGIPTKSPRSDRYIQLIFAMYILFSLGTYFIDNIFYTQVESQLTDQDQLASFLGIFSGVVGGISLCNQLFFAPRLLSRYGVRAAILLTPMLLIVSTILFTLTGTFSHLTSVLLILAAIMNLTRQALDESDNTAANLLYQPLPAALRTRAQTTVDGIIYPSAGGLAGLFLLWLTSILHFNAVQLAYMLLPILACWAITTLLLGSAYPKRVQQALRQRIIRGNSGFRPDRASLEILQQSLISPHAGVVIYALNMLADSDGETLVRCLPDLLKHPNKLVRLDVLMRLEQLGSIAALPAINQCFQTDPDSTVRSAALRTLATLGGPDCIDAIYSYLDAPDPQLKQGVMVGLLRNGELEGILAVGETLARLIESPSVADRVFAAQVVGESGLAGFYRLLLKLLCDGDPLVQRAALAAAGQLQQPKLWPVVIDHLALPKTRAAAQAAIVAGGEATLIPLKMAFAQAGQQRQLWIELARTCGRIGSLQAAALLLPHLDFPDIEIRTQILATLVQCDYQAGIAERPLIDQQIQAEFAHAAWTLATLNDLGEDQDVTLLQTTLVANLAQQRMRLFLWLALLYEPTTIRRVRDALSLKDINRQPSDEQRAYALETLDGLVAHTFKQNLLALLDDLSPSQMLTRLAANFPQPKLNQTERLGALIRGPEAWLSPWVKAVALYTVNIQARATDEPSSTLQIAVTQALSAPTALVRETAAWTLAVLTADKQPNCQEGEMMLLTIEKVMILKTVDIFAATPDEILVDIAALLKELRVPAGALIFEKGEQGDSMYLIVEGEVEARDGAQVFTRMGERQVFGEMALLDGEPRTASIYATQATHLLRLDQEPFYELMDDRIEVARGIIHVLLQRLRLRTIELNNAQAKLNEATRYAVIPQMTPQQVIPVR
ncbi:hypothetical protein BH10CHL1_BH10CHL1_38210 [soil metagenome]